MRTDFFSAQDFVFPKTANYGPNGKFAFTVDVEEWFQVGAFENCFDRSEWVDLESRVEQQTHVVIDLLAALGIKATFFILGWVAERFPKLISTIGQAGHEIACHGMDHRRLFEMSRSEFASDLKKSKDVLEAAGGKSVFGYRAPSFSLTPDVWWVYEELAQAGFRYSSSLYPVKTDHYGSTEAPRRPFFPTERQDVLEIPLTVCDMPFKRVPASGGGYFRLLPYWLSSLMIGTGRSQSDSPAIFYMHPWEMDTEQPFVAHAPLLSRFRHYTGQKTLPEKLGRLSQAFAWGPIEEVFGSVIPAGGKV